MALPNKPSAERCDRYQWVIKRLHWCMVLSVVVTYITAYYRYWYTTQTEVANWYLLVVHINVGVLILALSIAMLFLRFYSIKRPKTTREWAASLMHCMLYFMLCALPLSAYLGIGVDLPLFGVINLPSFARFEFGQYWLQKNLGMLMITFMEPLANFHRDIGADYLLPTLLLGHIGAAIFLNLDSSHKPK